MTTKKKPDNKPESTWGKVWYFIWKSNSWESWVVNIILAFLLIKYIVYPGLALIFATSHPIVAVVSGSMYHGLEKQGATYSICGKTLLHKDFRASFDNWWKECGDWYILNLNKSKEDFYNFHLHNGFAKGDIIFLKGQPPDKLEIGDVIVFNGNEPYPIIHRIVNVSKEESIYYFTTKGDHNPGSGSFDKHINQNQIIGEAIFRLPFLGYVKIWAVDLLQIFL